MKVFLSLCLTLVILNATAQNFSIPATSQHSGGTYSIYRTPANNTVTISQLRKAVIWVEGFEVAEPVTISQNYTLMGSNLTAQLHAAGYDIIILNFNDATDNIQRNAEVLEQLIVTVNAGKPTSDELVIMGYSMGGLVARYALVEMENDSIDHKTRLYISYDSPHKGANVPLGIQDLVSAFSSPSYTTFFPEIATLSNRFNSPAAKQMLKYRTTGVSGVVPVSPFYTSFQNEINNLNANGGFPVNCENIALSLGSWTGIPQRSNYDTDNNGTNDYQLAGFPAVYINFPASSGSGQPTNIWNLNPCQSVAAFTFQAFISTSLSASYPYVSTRTSFVDPDDSYYATFWYRNSGFSGLAPSGAWSRYYNPGNQTEWEPVDFAPGSLTNSYEQVVQALNGTSGNNCSFALYNNSTFIPTTSALAYTTNDMFAKIGEDVNRLTKTPFDDIFALCDENRSHTQTISPAPVVNWVMNKIAGSAPVLCTCESDAAISGTSLVCDANSSFYLNNIDAGTVVTWQASPSYLFTTASGTGNSAILKASSPTISGNGTLTYTITTACNAAPITMSKTFWVGPPSTGISALFNSSHHWVTFGPSNPQPATTYSWVIEGISYPYSNAIHPLQACGGSPYITYYNFQATLTATNSCGTITTCTLYKFTCVPGKTFTSLGPCGGGGEPPPCNPSLMSHEVSPNPARGMLTVNALRPPPCESFSSAEAVASGLNDDAGKDEADLEIQRIWIYDMQGREKLVKFGVNKKDTDIDVSSLTQGIYILKIETRKNIEQHRILIE